MSLFKMNFPGFATIAPPLFLRLAPALPSSPSAGAASPFSRSLIIRDALFPPLLVAIWCVNSMFIMHPGNPCAACALLGPCTAD